MRLRSWNLNLLDPTPYFEAVFRAPWEGSGGMERPRDRGDGKLADARLVATLESKPLPEVIRDINKFSNNVMARQVLLTLARLESDQPATAAAGAANLRAFLAEQGLEMPELVLENGLACRATSASPASLAALLAQARRSPLAPEFIASLPLAGIDGTARRRAVAAGYAHIKTGMLDGVRAIAGIVQARGAATT
ncbi:MAG: D-alanyl-D-alanine carboxypeptidase [Steroidobacteraceae bacterium]